MKKYLLAIIALVFLLPPGLRAASPSPDLASLQEKAKENDSSAQFNLGSMYARGQGVAQDYDEAVKWFSNAADRGDAYVGVEANSRVLRRKADFSIPIAM